ncbi:MAG TPA: phosphopantothenoylcysteine decarboxylase [Verrucomicrobiae bacterium]|nr:phosphopantothenoylcysteine decarboxylase [Verrucomicrobiae bacterium]
MKVLITAGPTREMLDPVRFLSNVSTGEMGYALASAAQKKGHHVTLISGPTALPAPRGARFISITSAAELKKKCETAFPRHDVLVMVAAVCDFTFPQKKAHKIRRTKMRQVRLVQTPDIVAGLARRKGGRIVIGFCLETEDWLRNARSKLKRKHLDGIVANYYSKTHIPFGDRRINTAFLSPGGQIQTYRKQPKSHIAKALIEWVEAKAKKSYLNIQK